MQINLTIQAGNPAELQEAIIGLTAVVSGAVLPQSSQVEPEREKSKRASRNTTLADKQPDPEPAAPQEPQPSTATEPPAADVPTVVQLRAAAQEKGKTPEGKRAIKSLLDEFGSKSISDVPEEQRATFLARLGSL